jgi:hypothetical protein
MTKRVPASKLFCDYECFDTWSFMVPVAVSKVFPIFSAQYSWLLPCIQGGVLPDEIAARLQGVGQIQDLEISRLIR